MNELDVLYQYTNAEGKAASVGLSLAATSVDFVLRDVTRHNQEFARCLTLAEVDKALDLRAEQLHDPDARR
jgi:hypothetical protein